jgi:hypothetical protein
MNIIIENAICNDEKLLNAISNSSYNVVKDNHNRICIIGFNDFSELENEIMRLSDSVDNENKATFNVKEIWADLDEKNKPIEYHVIDDYVDTAFDATDTLYADIDIQPFRVFKKEEEEEHIKEYVACLIQKEGWEATLKHLIAFKEMIYKYDCLKSDECIIYVSDGGWREWYEIVSNTCMEYDKIVSCLMDKERHYIGIVLEFEDDYDF